MFAKYAKVRDQKGMTDSAVCEKAGLNQTVIAEWKRRAVEKPDSELSVINAVKVAAALGCSLDEIIGEEE